MDSQWVGHMKHAQKKYPIRVSMKPIDSANKEIKLLKMLVTQLSEELKEVHNDIRPLQLDLEKRIKIDKEKDTECVIESSSWWWT